MSAYPHSRVVGERRLALFGRRLRTISIGLRLLATALCVSATTSGQAADYSLAYGIELNGKRDMGVLNECKIAQLCVVRDTRSGVTIYVALNDVDDRIAFLSISGHQRACCVLSGGAESAWIDVGKNLIRVPIFAGRRLRGNEFIVGNTSVGVLWLSFSIVPKPRPQMNSERRPI